MGEVNRFEDLECWKHARKLNNQIYELAERIGSRKDFVLISQITGASISIMNNIAEGYASKSVAEFMRFLTYSRRSCCELQNCLYIASDRHHLNKTEFQNLYDQASEVRKIVDGLIRYLKRKKSS